MEQPIVPEQPITPRQERGDPVCPGAPERKTPVFEAGNHVFEAGNPVFETGNVRRELIFDD